MKKNKKTNKNEIKKYIFYNYYTITNLETIINTS